MKNTVASFRAAKGRQKLSMLTAYDYSMARLVDESGINSILVGDSLGMVMLGYKNTLPVSMEDMIRHCAAVARGTNNALLICDMPYLSSQISVEQTLANAGRLIKEGQAEAVKLEGGADFCPEIRALVRASIPVLGHLGLTPQSLNALGAYRVQGKSMAQAQKLLDDARAVQDAGVFGLVLECVPAALAQRISRELEIPTIGIGAGPGCDGQVLVWQDMLGLGQEPNAKFVRRFAEVGKIMREAFQAYDQAVKEGQYPAEEHCYSMEQEAELLEKLN